MITELNIFMSGGGCQLAYGKLEDGKYFVSNLFDGIAILDADYSYFNEHYAEDGFDADEWYDEHYVRGIDCCDGECDKLYEELCWKALRSKEVWEDAKIDCKLWLKDYYKTQLSSLEDYEI